MPVKFVFLPYIPGKTMQEKKKFLSSTLDYIRQMLTFEPRAGGSNSYGVVVTSPVSPDAQFGAVYFDSRGWVDMCGHATMCLASLAVQRKLLEFSSNNIVNVVIDTPAGKVTLDVHTGQKGEVHYVSLINVPSFLYASYKVNLKEFGYIDVPVLFGGDFYAIINLDSMGLRYSRKILQKLLNLSVEIFDQTSGNEIVHPILKDVKGLYGVRFQSKVSDEPLEMYGVLFYGSKNRLHVDRSPSGTSSSAHLAYLYFVEKRLKLGQDVEFFSAIETKFIGRVIREVEIGKINAIVPQISSIDKACYITGYSTYVIDPLDKLREGFIPLEPFY